MVKFFYIMTFLAQYDPAYVEAGDTTRRALLETPQMQEEIRVLKDEAEREVYEVTGLTPEELAYAGYAYPIISGKLSTKPFRNFKYERDGVTIVPELEFDFRSNETSTAVFFIKTF